MGVGMKTDGWPGAQFWQAATDDSLTIDTLIERSEAVVVGVDGGGLDDLYGLNALGREPADYEIAIKVDGQEQIVKTKRWLSWSHAWCHRQVLQLRQTIAARLEDFERAGDLTIVDNTLISLAENVAIIRKIYDAGKLACVAIDPEGPYGELVDALAELGITED